MTILYLKQKRIFLSYKHAEKGYNKEKEIELKKAI